MANLSYAPITSGRGKFLGYQPRKEILLKYHDISLGRVEAVWNKLGGEEGVRLLLSGESVIVPKKNLVEHNILRDSIRDNVSVPNNWKVFEHHKDDRQTCDILKANLWYSDDQRDGKSVEGNKLREELVGKPVLNACVLDYLLANQSLIPREWEGKNVFFWGTIYRNLENNTLCVRGLCCQHGRKWYRVYSQLSDNWCCNSVAALRAD